jgi:hypothetical protein
VRSDAHAFHSFTLIAKSRYTPGRRQKTYFTEILISPSPSIPPVMTSPRCTGPTPSGVPVMIMSPGSSAIDCEQIEIMSDTGQIRFDLSESCLSTPSKASQMRPAFGCPTSKAGRSGRQGEIEVAVTLFGAHRELLQPSSPARTALVEFASRHSIIPPAHLGSSRGVRAQ